MRGGRSMLASGPLLGVVVSVVVSVPAVTPAVAADEPPALTRTTVSSQEPGPLSPEMTDRLIVATTSAQVGDAAVTQATEQAAADLGVTVDAQVVTDITPRASVVSLGEALPLADVQALADAVAQEATVAYAEPDRIVRPVVTLPNDQLVPDQWGLWDASGVDGGYSTRAPDAWPTAKGSGVVVAVIDTGITAHPDLDAQVVAGYDFVSSTQVANDGDGWDANPADPGDWITVGESLSGFFAGCQPTTSTWHGTHVAGTVAAVTDDTIGVAGIAPLARIQPVRALGKCGGYTSDVATSIRWAAGLAIANVPANATPARVINMSLGGTGSCSVTEQSAIDAARSQGTVVVVAAGNENAAASTSSPGNCTGVITVAAHSRDGNRASFSNYGPLVEISGPGVGITSTLNTGTQGPASPTYESYSGTSMATPHVAATAALLLSAAPSLSPDEVLTRLQASVQPFAAGSACIGLCGSGYVDARAALASLVPGAPVSVTLTPGRESLGVNWSAPSGLLPQQYDVEYSDDSATWSSATSTATTSTTITGLSDDSTYWVRVRANAAGGSSAWTVSPGGTPLAPTVPIAPGAITVTAGDALLGLSWSQPSDNGGRTVTSYAVEYSRDDSTWTAVAPVAGTSTTLTQLTNGQRYSVRVAAVNALGTGPWTLASGTPTAPSPSGGGGGGGGGGGAPPPPATPTITPPGPPDLATITPGDHSLTVGWTDSDDTGGEIPDSYVIDIEHDGVTATIESAGAPQLVTGLDNGVAYRVRVAAVNSAGAGDWSAWSAATTPRGPASSPQQVEAVAGDGSATVSWTAPVDDGGSVVTGYHVEVTSSSGARTLTASTTSTRVVGLVNGQSYAIRVAAVTDFGVGEWSSSISVSPRAVHVSVPRDVAATRTGRKVAVTWLPPANGTPLRYVVSASINGAPYRKVDGATSTRATFRVPVTARTVRVQVMAVDKDGPGPRSTPVESRERSLRLIPQLSIPGR